MGSSWGATQARITPQPRYELTRALRELFEGKRITGFAGEWHAEVTRARGQEAAAYDCLRIPTGLFFTRDMTVAGSSGSQFLVGTNQAPGSFIDMLRNRSVALRMGARLLPNLRGNVTIPKQSASATAYWLSTEATEITESQPTIGQLSLTPKTVGAYTELTRLMLLQSDPSADLLVIDDFAKVLALAIDTAIINGSGAAGQPTGLLNTSGIGSVTGTNLQYAGLLEFQTDVAMSNALEAKCGYVSTPSVASTLAQRQRFTSTDSPLWGGNLLDGQVCGYPAMSSNGMPAATMIFGDWSHIILAEWGTLEITASDSEASNFKNGIIGIRAFQTVDVGVRVPAAFTAATSIT